MSLVSPGTPTFIPPAYNVPTFNSAAVSVGSTVTVVKIESTASSTQTNVPFRFGQVFKAGDLAPSNFLVGKISGQADVPLQFNVLATFPDGSVRHAVISGVLPTLAASAVIDMALVRSDTGVSTTPIAASSLSGLLASVVLSFAGVAYTADATPAILALAASKARAPGAASTEYNVTIAPTTAGGVPHPDLEVKFDVVYFPAASAFRVDVTFEHTKAYTTTGDLTYSGTIQVGGSAVYTLPNPLTHFPHARWKRTHWMNNAAPAVARQNRDYWIDSKAVPNYDRSVVIAEGTLNGYAASAANAAFAPMGNGIFYEKMATQGGRPDIGLMPSQLAATVLCMDKRAIALTLACGITGGSWGTHFRDTSTGPGAGMPISSINWPYTTVYNASDANNPNTGKNEAFIGVTSSTTLEPEEAHTPNFAYLPYLLTGDLYYLEEMQFWSTWVLARQNPGYRAYEQGLVYRTQTRGQAWMLRALVECAAFTPDSHPLKSHYGYWVAKNLEFYNSRYTDNPNANKLGVLDAIDDVQYGINGTYNGIGMYQDDFFTQTIGHAAELGFSEAKRLLLWKAKFQVGRLIAPGYCFNQAAMLSLRIRAVEAGADYNTLAECMAGHVGAWVDGMGVFTPAIAAQPCNSQARVDAMNSSPSRQDGAGPFVVNEIVGWARGTEGYPSNLQPALAMSVDAGYQDADLAWDLFNSRSVKPDYSTGPQFAIVPRTSSTTPPSTPTTTPGTKYMTFDRVKTTTTTTGTGNITVSASPAARCRPLSVIPIGTAKVPLVIEDESGTAWEEVYCTVLSATTFSRDTVISGSNGTNKVDFGAGTKSVFCTISADQLNSFLTESSLPALGTPLADYMDANEAGTIAPTDKLPIGRAGSIFGGAITSVASAVLKLLTGKGEDQVTITATSAFPLDFAAHNGRTLYCKVAPSAITAPALFSTVGNGFHCEIVNLSGADFPLLSGVLPAGASAKVRAFEGSIYAATYGAAPAAASGGTTVTAPGQVTGLTAGTATDTTQPLTWTAPATGTAPFTYKVEVSPDGTNWTTFAAAVSGTTSTVTGRTASTSYKYRVSAVNSAGTGTPSAVVTASTAAAAGASQYTVTALAGAPTAWSTFGGGDEFCTTRIVPPGGKTISAVYFYFSTDNTAFPTPSIGSGTTPQGMSYNTSAAGNNIYNIVGFPLGFSVPGPTGKQFYFWVRIDDSTGGISWYLRNNPVTFMDSGAQTKTTADEVLVAK